MRGEELGSDGLPNFRETGVTMRSFSSMLLVRPCIEIALLASGSQRTTMSAVSHRTARSLSVSAGFAKDCRRVNAEA
jgi:hypothetical protein